MGYIQKQGCAFWRAGECHACTDKCRYSSEENSMIPERMTSFHAADGDTGASMIFHIISEQYVQWLEERISAFIQQAGERPEFSNAFASKAFEELRNWYASTHPIK